MLNKEEIKYIPRALDFLGIYDHPKNWKTLVKSDYHFKTWLEENASAEVAYLSGTEILKRVEALACEYFYTARAKEEIARYTPEKFHYDQTHIFNEFIEFMRELNPAEGIEVTEEALLEAWREADKQTGYSKSFTK